MLINLLLATQQLSTLFIEHIAQKLGLNDNKSNTPINFYEMTKDSPLSGGIFDYDLSNIVVP
jgi:hypothetical protein